MKIPENTNTKKIIGIVFLIIGLTALVTPFTPGSWLIFVGLEFLGLRFLFWERIKNRFGKSGKEKDSAPLA